MSKAHAHRFSGVDIYRCFQSRQSVWRQRRVPLFLDQRKMHDLSEAQFPCEGDLGKHDPLS